MDANLLTLAKTIRENAEAGYSDDTLASILSKGLAELPVGALLAAANDAVRELGNWLTDNTEKVFEEQPEIDGIRSELNDAIEAFRKGGSPAPALQLSDVDKSVLDNALNHYASHFEGAGSRQKKQKGGGFAAGICGGVVDQVRTLQTRIREA